MKSTRIWVIIILVLAFLGLADSAYLAEHALAGVPLICNIQSLSGCNIVAGSEYSRIFGIPLGVYGVVFYGLLFVLSALELVIFDQLLRRIIQGLATIGFLASAYFLMVQIFLIGAFCIYCFLSAVIAILVLGCATRIEPIPLRRKQGVADQKKPPFYSEFFAKPKSTVPFAPHDRQAPGELRMPPEA